MNYSLLFLRIRKIISIFRSFFLFKTFLKYGVLPSLEHGALLRSIGDIDMLIDVGANKGQFSLEFLFHHPYVPIFAFEPIVSLQQIYLQVFGRYSNVFLHPIALGASSGSVDMNLSRSLDSSSLLSITDQQVKLFPGTSYSSTCQIYLDRFDSLGIDVNRYSSILLKIDVQGFELNVLEGFGELLNSVKFVYVECSFLELYETQPLFGEINSFLTSNGFSILSIANPVYSSSSKLVQADFLYASD